MGQKVNPNGLRIGISRPWTGRWYADRKVFADTLKQDIDIRRFLEPLLKNGGLSRIDIERAKGITITAHVQNPGLILGQDGKNKQVIDDGLQKLINGKFTKKQLATKNPTDIPVKLVLVEVKNPDFDAALVARSIADQIENRASFRMVQKKAIQRVRKAGAKGIKTQTSGRLNCAEIHRTEMYKEGALGLETLSANIDYALAEAHTMYGVIGVKVWIARPDNFDEDKAMENNPDRKGGFRGNRRPGQGDRRGFNRPQQGRTAPVAPKKGE